MVTKSQGFDLLFSFEEVRDREYELCPLPMMAQGFEQKVTFTAGPVEK